MNYGCEYADCELESTGIIPVPSLIGGQLVELKGRFCAAHLALAKRLAEEERARLTAARNASAASARSPLPRQLG